MEKEVAIEQKQTTGRTTTMQEIINHLVLGITMWVSATLTCVTTILAVGNYWCLIVLILPFTYTMFPQIQKFTTSLAENGYAKVKEKKLEYKQKQKEAKSAERIKKLELEAKVQEKALSVTQEKE